MIHIHVTSGSPALCSRGAVWHPRASKALCPSGKRRSLLIRRLISRLRRSIALLVRSRVQSLRRKIHIGQGFSIPSSTFLAALASFMNRSFPMERFFWRHPRISCAWIAASISATVFILLRGVTENSGFSVKMNCYQRAYLASRKDFTGIVSKHAEFLSPAVNRTSKPRSFSHEERTPAFTIFLHPFSGTRSPGHPG